MKDHGVVTHEKAEPYDPTQDWLAATNVGPVYVDDRLSQGYLDMHVPDVRGLWKKLEKGDNLQSCGMHRKFTWEDLFTVQESLLEMLVMAGVDNPDTKRYLAMIEEKKKAKREERQKKDEMRSLIREVLREVIREELGGRTTPGNT